MTASYVPNCPHHAYFRFLKNADPSDPRGPKVAARIACDNGLSDDEVVRHHLEDAYRRGTAEFDGIIR